MSTTDERVTRTDEEWRAALTPEQYAILRRGATERANTGQYVHVKADGMYLCAGCGAELFDSHAKYDSGSGWPSFWEPVDEAALESHRDFKLLVPRTEVRCARCGGHLGHVFNDGPEPTGQRFCINSGALRFAKGAESGATPTEDSGEV